MIYFDNSATTRPYKEVVELVSRLMYEEFGNSSSMHNLGIRAERILENARKTLADTIKASPEEIIFTSGGTESVNMAIRGSADVLKRYGKHILTSPVEHSASLETLKALENMGFQVEYLKVDGYGKILLDDLREKLRSDTIFVNIMAVNNELGTIEPITEAAAIIRENSDLTLFHVDAVQAYGKIPINVRSIGADLMSFSAHKIHGPKGVGMLYIKKGTRLNPLITGGGHEHKMRSGTVNVPGIAGFALAASTKIGRMKEDQQNCRKVREKLLNELNRRMNELGMAIRVNSPEDGADNILNVSFKGVKAENILHFLEMHDIYVSSGSACHSRKDAVSHVLKAAKVPNEWSQGAIRFSFSGDNTEEEAIVCAEKLAETMRTLGKK